MDSDLRLDLGLVVLLLGVALRLGLNVGLVDLNPWDWI